MLEDSRLAKAAAEAKAAEQLAVEANVSELKRIAAELRRRFRSNKRIYAAKISADFTRRQGAFGDLAEVR